MQPEQNQISEREGSFRAEYNKDRSSILFRHVAQRQYIREFDVRGVALLSRLLRPSLSWQYNLYTSCVLTLGTHTLASLCWIPSLSLLLSVFSLTCMQNLDVNADAREIADTKNKKLDLFANLEQSSIYTIYPLSRDKKKETKRKWA